MNKHFIEFTEKGNPISRQIFIEASSIVSFGKKDNISTLIRTQGGHQILVLDTVDQIKEKLQAIR